MVIKSTTVAFRLLNNALQFNHKKKLQIIKKKDNKTIKMPYPVAIAKKVVTDTNADTDTDTDTPDCMTDTVL